MERFRYNKWFQLFVGLAAFLVFNGLAFLYMIEGRLFTEAIWRSALVVLSAALGVGALVYGAKRFKELNRSNSGV